MIAVEDFTKELIKNDMGPVVEVPCSYLKEFLSYLHESGSIRVINPANEALAMGIASGEYLGSRKLPIVAIQNSGFLNTLNALTSLNQIYDIPIFMIVTWRGEGGKGMDAPEHDIVGKNLESILKTFKLPYEILSENNFKEQISKLSKIALQTKKPVALVIKKQTFEPYISKTIRQQQISKLSRFEAIKSIKSIAKNRALIISGTGYPTRDSFSALDTPDFYIVGSMGHALSIGLGVADNTDKKIIILDGDGGSLMHAGGLGSLDDRLHTGIIYIVLDNQMYESTGGQPTISARVNFYELAASFGFKSIFEVFTKKELGTVINHAIETNKPALIHIKVTSGSGNVSKRVSDTYTCPEIKKRFMKAIQK